MVTLNNDGLAAAMAHWLTWAPGSNMMSRKAFVLMLHQNNYKNSRGSIERRELKLVVWWRIELQTYCLEGSCSIQLSYQTIFVLRLQR